MRMGLHFKTLLLSSEITIVRSMCISYYHKNSISTHLKIFDRNITFEMIVGLCGFQLRLILVYSNACSRASSSPRLRGDEGCDVDS